MTDPRHESLRRLIEAIDVQGCPNCHRDDLLERHWVDASDDERVLDEITCLRCRITWTLR